MSKYRIYVDEVGNASLKDCNKAEPHLCLTGVIFDLEYIKEVVHPQIEAIKTKFFNSHPDNPVIFHRKELVYSKPPFSALQDDAIRTEFDKALMKLFHDWDYQVITVLIDKQEHDEKYASWKYDPYHYCQEILVERYRLFLNIKNAVGDMMYESSGGKEDTRLKTSFNRIMKDGTHNITAEDLHNHFTSKKLKVTTPIKLEL